MVNTEVAKAKKRFCSEFSVRTLEGDKDLNHCLDPKNELGRMCSRLEDGNIVTTKGSLLKKWKEYSG